MNVPKEASAHCSKAEEFLSMAALALASGKTNAAASNAVLAGINAKDAICLMSMGRTRKSDDHRSAIAELQSAGPIGKSQAQRFQRLLALKNDAQYQSGDVSHARASKGLEWATDLVSAANESLHPS